MTIEVLFPELCNLYGDLSNIRYLKACVPEAEVILTDNQTAPCFTERKVDLVYIGSMAEQGQAMAIRQLQPHLDCLRERINQEMAMLVTGNAMELLGTHVQEDGKRIEMLGLFPYHAERDMENRHNSMFLGQFEEIPIVGYKSQFSSLHGEFPGPFIQVRGGFGNTLKDKSEGYRYKNLFATYLLGPFLVLNPLFTKYLLRLLGQDDTLAYEQEVMEAYQFRKEHLEEPGVNFLVGEHG